MPSQLDLEQVFAPSSPQQWEELVERSLGGTPPAELGTVHDGILHPPLCWTRPADLDCFPGTGSFTRGNQPAPCRTLPWEVCALLAHPDPHEATEQARAALANGAHALWLRCRTTPPPADADLLDQAVVLTTANDLAPLLEVVTRRTTPAPVYLSPCGSEVTIAAFIGAARLLGLSAASLQGSLGADPLGMLVTTSRLPCTIEDSMARLADTTSWVLSQAPGMRAITLSGLPYHMAGATAVQEIGYLLATGIEYLRGLERCGIGVARAAPQFSGLVAVGSHLFTQLAKLRALRLLWTRVLGACGVTLEESLHVHAVTSPRIMTTLDKWGNLLRTSAAAMTAALGGAETITTLPCDLPGGSPATSSRRLALTSQHVLMVESDLDAVIDPAGGSYYLEQLTLDLASAAWAVLQRVEAAGGMGSFLLSGELNRELTAVREQRRQYIARRTRPITGVSAYAFVNEPQSAVESVAGTPASPESSLHRAAKPPPLPAPGDGARLTSLSQLAASHPALVELEVSLAEEGPRLEPLSRCRDAASFEQLRTLAERHLTATGGRPIAFVAAVGDPAELRRVRSLVDDVLLAGGIATVPEHPFAEASEAAAAAAAVRADVAVICTPPGQSTVVAPPLAAALKAEGVQLVVLAAELPEPSEALSSKALADVDELLVPGCDILALLTRLHTVWQAAP